MVYNPKNKGKRIERIIEIYKLYKEQGLFDSQIVKQYFPLHGIKITYRTWMNYKSLIPPQNN